MDDSAAPWRVLEDPADRATRAGGASATPDEKGDRLPAWITWQAIIGMSVAAVLALGAFVVARRARPERYRLRKPAADDQSRVAFP
jgi:hypothetical protein